MYRSIIVGFVVVAVTIPALAGPAEDAAKAFAQGKALLAEGDFHGALEAYREATANDLKNSQGYRQHYSMLSQVIRLRMKIEKEQDPDRWDKMAAALRSFNADNNLHSEALAIDQESHKRHRVTASAIALAETQLALDMSSEAINTLSGLGQEERTPRARALLGLALARQGQIDQAKELAAKVDAGKDSGPRLLYDLACLRARIGDTQGALEALTRCFELTSPYRLGSLKADAQTCSDFAAFAGASGFARALETQSKVKASGCGGKCTGCSKKSSAKCKQAQKAGQAGAPCAHHKGAQDPKADASKTPCGHSKSEHK